MTYRSRGRSHNEAIAAIIFAGFLTGFIFYLCVGNYQRAKRAMERQRKRRLELEEEKRALALSPNGRADNIGISDHRRRINVGCGTHDSPRSNYSGTSSMYTDEKGLTVGVGGVEVVGDRSHMIVGGSHGSNGSGFAIPHQRNATVPPRDLLDDDRGQQTHASIRKTNSEGEMSV
ncbi:hypothetical protein ACHAXS_000744 [Conticribra weissflogii]